MELKIDSKKLLEKFQYLNGVISNNSTMPILDNFYLEIETDKMQITASDLENTFVTSIELLESVMIKQELCINAKIIIEILKAIPHQPLTLKINENNTVDIVSESGNYSIAYSDAVQYPKVKSIVNPKGISISSDTLLKGISKTVFAASNDDLRPVLTGVFIESSTELITFVATNAHKLAKYSVPTSNTESFSFICPKKPLLLLKSILENGKTISIEYNETNALFDLGNYKLTTRLVDGKYPNYEAVIPKDNPYQVIVNRLSLLNSIKMCSIFSSKETNSIKLHFKEGNVAVSAEDINYSKSAIENLACVYAGDEIAIGFNARYFMELLSNIDSEEIYLQLSDPRKAGILLPVEGETNSTSLMLLMPTLLS
ncbi:DNA polymerase III subunit beta [Flavobacterium oreochromis]|uniref:DNA polymerase III subunit beta n=1 Tax=Flavobacterium oreochromis TaxID=2906078 RepID=UPI001CE4F6C5|nr:DNA polymerase III subunit beta [Flavobacterium oreochromis]QYS85430.1 DNA polymerase III subunit beta [Flavobacterium oreochromis]